MQVGKGDVPSQRQRRRRRYRGCRVCGIPNAKWCAECKIVVDVLRLHWPPALSLIVDGGFVPVSGERSESGVGYGGAGLVLVNAEAVIAS